MYVCVGFQRVFILTHTKASYSLSLYYQNEVKKYNFIVLLLILFLSFRGKLSYECYTGFKTMNSQDIFNTEHIIHFF